MIREIVKRLHSFGLVNLIVEPAKLIDYVHLQLYVFFDEIIAAFEKHEVYETFKDKISVFIDGNTDWQTFAPLAFI